jgi:hypothetical protein
MPYGGELDAVSCPSTTACIAVGGYVKKSARANGLAAGQWAAGPAVPPSGPPEVTG